MPRHSSGWRTPADLGIASLVNLAESGQSLMPDSALHPRSLRVSHESPGSATPESILRIVGFYTVQFCFFMWNYVEWRGVGVELVEFTRGNSTTFALESDGSDESDRSDLSDEPDGDVAGALAGTGACGAAALGRRVPSGAKPCLR